MRRGIYVIRDTKAANIIGRPMLESHNAVAVRSFTEVMQNRDESNIIRKYPDDFELVCLGTLESDNETITPRVEIILTGRALYDALNPVTTNADGKVVANIGRAD